MGQFLRALRGRVVRTILALGLSAIERMLETMRWVQWLEVEQRHLIWMRAKRYSWRDISIRAACCTRTAQRRWQGAIQSVADHGTRAVAS